MNDNQGNSQLATVIDVIKKARCDDVVRTTYDYQMMASIKDSIMKDLKRRYPVQLEDMDMSIPTVIFSPSSRF